MPILFTSLALPSGKWKLAQDFKKPNAESENLSEWSDPCYFLFVSQELEKKHFKLFEKLKNLTKTSDHFVFFDILYKQ